jgi:TonB family protein
MLQPLQLQQVATRYPQQIAELRGFLADTGLRLESADTLSDVASRLRQDRAFRRDLISHVWVVLHLSGDISYSSLLGVLALAAAGPHFAADAQEADAHDLLRFLMEARTSFESLPTAMPGPVQQAPTDPPARRPVGPVALPSALPATRRAALALDTEPDNSGKIRIAGIAACLLLAMLLGVWLHIRAASHSAAPTVTAAATPLPQPTSPPAAAASPVVTRGSQPVTPSPSAMRTTPSRPAKPSPLVLREARPAAPVGRTVIPVHLGTSAAPAAPAPRHSTSSAAAASSEAPAPQPSPLPRRRAAGTPGRPVAITPAPNLLAAAAPPQPAPANNSTTSLPHAGYVRPTSLGTMAANVMYSPAPAYPAEATAAHVQGEVRLEAEVDPDGNVTSTRIISGPPLLRDAASEAVQQWRYRPYLYGGKPIAMNAMVVMDFHLP